MSDLITHTCLTMAFDSVRVILSKSQDNMLLRGPSQEGPSELVSDPLARLKSAFPGVPDGKFDVVFCLSPLESLISQVGMVVFYLGGFGRDFV